MKIILGSSSTARLDLLRKLGYEPDLVISPEIDETPSKKEKPKDISLRLAKQKAEKIAKDYPEDLVISADTVTSLGRLSLPKATTEEEAIFCINKLSGKRHKVYTSICIIQGEKKIAKTSETVIKVKKLSDSEIEEYLLSRDWYNKAGGFSINDSAGAFVEYIRGAQESNVRGLPLNTLSKMLNSFGAKKNITRSEKNK